MSNIYDFSIASLSGSVIDFQQFKGKALLIVNTASRCGLTPQLEALQELYAKYKDQGLVVIGFPCNQFGNQEPLEGDDITEFCQVNYGVDFLITQKIDVNGDNAHPIFTWLKSQQGGLFGDAIKWNFTKFLVGKDGRVLDRYAPITKPKDLEKDILKALA